MFFWLVLFCFERQAWQNLLSLKQVRYLRGEPIIKKDENIGNPSKVDVPKGDNVEVRPHSKVGLRFKHVKEKGTASATPATTYPPHPQGKFLSEVFLITNTAAFSEVVTVAISFDGTGLTENQKKKLKVYRNDLKSKSVWDELTSSIDTKNNIAYGETDHFSVFGVR